jgi:glycine/D-amino acid oxidase-like deaminating enzyme
MNRHRTDVVILGAGLQGAGLALELARRGIQVTLIDQDPRPLNRASLRNEGKIHLGFIYANDRSRTTAFLQLEGALRFRSILSCWIGQGDDWLVPSAPFHYLVARDSLVSADQLAKHYAAIDQQCRVRFEQDAKLDYLGVRPQSLVRPLEDSEIADYFDSARFAAGFATAERAVDTEVLAEALRRALAQSANITFLPSHTARTISEKQDEFCVEGDGPAGVWSIRAHQVANAMWERRLGFDRQLGIPPPEHLLHRLKFRVIGRIPRELRTAPSVSMVLGRYGDMVIRTDGTAYLSWYPAGLRGWSHDLEPPEDWNPACRGEVSSSQAGEIASQIQRGIEDWCPAIAQFEPLQVDAGAIVAVGQSDVDDPDSGLHNRSRIGVTSHGGYHSVDPGKLTTAPLFAIEAADRVEAFQLAMTTGS